MFSLNFDSDCDGEQNRPFNTRKQRVIKGVNSQTVHREENSALLKDAKSKRWVFHMPGDAMSFKFEFIDCRWPKDMDIATKLSLQPGDSALLKFSEKAEYAYVSARADAKGLIMVERVVNEKITERTEAQPDVVINMSALYRK